MDGFHDSKWFVYINDHHEGPFSMGQLQSKLQTGEINRNHYVWCEGMPDWQVMTSIRELDAILTLTSAPIFPEAEPDEPEFESDPEPVFFHRQDEVRSPESSHSPAPARSLAPVTPTEPEPRIEIRPVAPVVEAAPEPELALEPEPAASPVQATPIRAEPEPALAAEAKPATIQLEPRQATPAPTFELEKRSEPKPETPVERQPDPVLEPTPVFEAPVEPAPRLEPKWEPEPEPEAQPESGAHRETLDELRSSRFDDAPVGAPLDEEVAPRHEPTASMTFGSISNRPARSGGFLKIFLILALIGAGAFAYVSGTLDPVLKHPQFRSALATTSSLLSPVGTRLAQWVPQLQSFISPVPAFPGVEAGELAELRNNAKSSEPLRLALAIEKASSSTPGFHVSAPLPDGTRIDLILVGRPETLLSQTSLVLKATGEISSRLVSFDDLRQPDGRPLAQGQYEVIASESEAGSQLPEVEAVLGALPLVKSDFPAESGVQGERRLFIRKTYFVGGEKDENYAKRLKDFHDRLRTRSNEELSELSQIVQTLTLQLSATMEEHQKVFSASGAKAVKTAEKQWNEFHDKWTGVQTRLESGFAGWAEALSKQEFYHWGLYVLVRNLSEKISQLHVQQHSGVLIRPTDLKEYQTQLQEKEKLGRQALLELDTKLTESKKLNEGIEGMPKRLSFEGLAEAIEESDEESIDGATDETPAAVGSDASDTATPPAEKQEKSE